MKYSKLPNIKILDESNKVLHQKSKEVTFPLDEETKQIINDALDYLEMSQIDKTVLSGEAIPAWRIVLEDGTEYIYNAYLGEQMNKMH